MSTPGNPLPIQFTPFTADHFKDESGIAFVNQQFSQIITALNANNGVAGRVTLPNGIDVKGATVTGVGAPQGPTDAVSNAHVEQNYSSKKVSSDLDIGGPNALKGLTSIYGQTQKNTTDIATIQAALAAGVTGTIVIPKLTGGGANGSITVTKGIITAFANPT